MNVIEECIKYVVDAVDGYTIEFDKLHPWRTDGKHVLQHALRVKAYAETLVEMEGVILSSVDEVALPVALILHDVGSILGREEHARKSADLVKPFLDKIIKDQEVKDRVDYLILNHSKKKNRPNDTVMNIMIDADLLDELGMQSAMMCSNWVNRDTPYYFLDLQERIETKEIEFIDRIMDITVTKSAKQIVNKKKTFLETVINQLDFENRGSLSREAVELIKEK